MTELLILFTVVVNLWMLTFAILPILQGLEKKSGSEWVRVRDWLPLEGQGKVQIWDGYDVGVGIYHKDKGWSEIGFCADGTSWCDETDDVTHWSPLLDQPEDEEDGEAK